ncbi:MarR family transcriptional regulator [Novosphingobium colocasiae]|uniref:MarR family transcriptional regulator n=1 Tax=Novosphingobium colocasiae TaxID=1256513 RepID=UPI0035B05F45
MGKPREFTTLPVRAIGDTRLTALELRCLMVIALHDGMSLVRGTGLGCYARTATLAQLARTDITNFSKAVSRLIKLEYVVREKQREDARRSTLRVLYGHDDSWQTGQQTGQEMLGELTNNPPEMVGEFTNQMPEIVGEGECENGRFPPRSAPQYIPLNGEIDFVRNEEINSVETARREIFAPREQQENRFGQGSGKSGKDSAEAGCPGGVSITKRLGQSWPKLEPLAQLIRLERELRAVGGLDAVHRDERLMWERYLFEMADTHGGQPAGYQAGRLLDELASETTEEGLPTDDLRAYLRATLKALGHGGQQRIADAAGVPYAKLHSFHHGSRLADEYLPAVQAACAAFLPLAQWRAAA